MVVAPAATDDPYRLGSVRSGRNTGSEERRNQTYEGTTSSGARSGATGATGAGYNSGSGAGTGAGYNSSSTTTTTGVTEGVRGMNLTSESGVSKAYHCYLLGLLTLIYLFPLTHVEFCSMALVEPQSTRPTTQSVTRSTTPRYNTAAILGFVALVANQVSSVLPKNCLN